MSKKKFQLVRYKTKDINFEVMCNNGTVIKYRREEIGFNKVPFSEEIYKNQSTGEVARESDLQLAFETTNKTEGEYQVSTKEKREMLDRKRQEIITYIHKSFVNPATKIPHPLTRIEQALKEVKYQISINKTGAKQCDEMFSQLVELIPLKKSLITGKVELKHIHIGKCVGILKKFCKVQSEKYIEEGCCYEVEICPGDYDIFFKELNASTKGDFNFAIDGTKANEDGEVSSKKKKGKGGKKKGKKKKGKKRKK